ncbi:MAG: type II toxin-antitoxin system VapC family toxin [Deltaproteobacteria bacterium]|nr:type II toxin-antitoxin system VapC family toxin [Deltaproteobacteria bacterium]
MASGGTISPLVGVELHCAIARQVRAGGIDRSSAQRVFSLFRAHLAVPRYRIVPVGAAEYDLARGWIEQIATPLRVLDALHLAAASSNELVLVTVDKEMARAAKHFAVEVQLVR